MNRQQGTALTWRSTFGISKRLTIDNFLASEMIDGEWRDYVGGGFTGYLNMVQVDVQVTRDLTSSLLAKQIAVQSSFDPLLFSFQLADYDSSWKFGSGMTVYQRQWKFGVDGLRFKFPFSRVSSCRLALKYTETEYSPDHTEKNAAITNYNQLLGINNSNSVIFQRVQNGTTRQDNVTGTSYINLLRGHVSLRGGVDYRILPDRIINNIEATGDIRLTKTFQMINTLGYSPGNSTFSEALTLNYTAPAFALALTGNYRTDQNWSAGIRLSMNLSRDPSRNKWVRDGSMRSQQGSIAARAFLDENRNGTFDSEEPLLKDVSFFINGQNNNTLTEKNGIAFIKGVSANTPADVSVSPTTLENLLWVPSGKGSCVVPRPGRPAEADFPIIVTGEISGTVTWRKEDSSKAAPGIIVQAVNGKGDVVGKTLTAYDGFFELKGVPPGEFTLRVSPEQAEKLGVVSPSKSVVIPPEGAFVDQIDLNLESISADGTGKE
ncbi:MAG: carboxypeptidase regulatory-like domain-containing protein [Chlorobiaceae bacterium]|nr:carboxypeptidase regulatory-like domain-containing protein [Chlorobiaceae bacterium]